MKEFLKEWWLQVVLLAVIILGVGVVQTQHYWAPRVYGEYVLFKLRNDGLGIVPKPQTLSAAVAEGAQYSIDSITFQVPWTIATTERLATTTALGLTNASDNKIVIFTRGVSSYNSYAQALATTPSDADFFGSTDAFSSKISMLAQKKESLFGIAPIYSFETNNGVRGFETAVNATSTAAMLFTPGGKAYEFVFGNLTPIQIGETLQSIKEAK